MTLLEDAKKIIENSIKQVQPDEAVQRALKNLELNPKGKVVLVAIGKAGWSMANAAKKHLGEKIHQGILITKYHHVVEEIPGIKSFEAGHPVPDQNTYRATKEVIELVEDLKEEDTVLFLVSGGGSALFEDPLVPSEELEEITQHLLGAGANIVEINTIRKRLSRVKGGKFGQMCLPAQVFAIVLSDVIGDPLDTIASGPAYPDEKTTEDAMRVIEKYKISLSTQAKEAIAKETPKELKNVKTQITGSVKELTKAAEKTCQDLGYETIVLTNELDGEALEVGKFLGAIGKTQASLGKKIAFIAGGETLVKLNPEGKGIGGRNQLIGLGAAPYIQGMENVGIFSLGSDGTDGPTDAAGSYVDGFTMEKLKEKSIDLDAYLLDNDSYHALKAIGGLIITGPTGSNVNDVSVVLVRP